MKTNLLKYSLFFILSLLFSCDSMLDVEVKSEISGSTYWKSENDFQPYLYGIYGNFRGHWDNVAFAEDRSECWSPGYNYRFSTYWIQDISSGKTSDWTNYYGMIGHCNLLIYQLENFAFSNTNLKKQITAEVYALRAAMYFYVAKIWGDVPLLLEPVMSEKEPLHPRTAVADVFKQINSDLKTALDNFADNQYPDKYRISKPAVYALLADVKMWEASVLGAGEVAYKEAINAIAEIEKSDVALVRGNYGDIFDIKKNKEIIWSFYLDRAEYASGSYNNAFPRFEGSGAADNVEELPIALAGQQAYCLSPEALALFATYPEDKRISRTYIPEIQQGEILNWWPNKFRGTKYSDQRIADSDMIVYRLSDMYLLKAEAYASVNQPQDALTYLNYVRERAGIPEYKELDVKTLKKEILAERGRELFHEIKRFWDLRRAHASGVIDIYQFIPNLRGKDTPLYWAVHRNLLVKNEALIQTEGYQD